MKGIRRTLAMVLVCAAVAGCSTTPDQSVETEAAKPVVLKPLTQEQIATLVARSEAELREGRHDEALNGFARALSADPRNGRALLGAAETHLAMGNAAHALKVLAAWPADMEATPEVQRTRGVALVRTGDDASAQPVLEQAVAGDPTLWRAWNALARIAERRGDPAAAERRYAKALEANPGAAVVYNNRGYSRLLLGDRDRALEDFRKAAALDSTLRTARANLILATALGGDYEGALSGVAEDELPVALNNVGFAAMSRRDYANAELYFSRALQDSARWFPTAAENLRWLRFVRGDAADSQLY